MNTDFRYALRHSTRADHDHLDQLISKLDIANVTGFRLFVQLHLTCFSAMHSRLSLNSRCRPTLERLMAGLRKDMHAVSSETQTIMTDLPGKIDPLAIDYMTAGSRMGTKVLYKLWANAADPAVRQATGYFGQPYDPREWQETCQALSSIPTDSPRATSIVADTQILFKLFASVFEALTSEQDALL